MRQTKEARRAALEKEFENGQMHVAQYREKLEALGREPDVGPVAPVEPELFVSMQQMRATLQTIAASIAPLVPRLEILERKLRALESKSMGTHIHANDCTIDGYADLSKVVADLNATLSRPVRPIYDDKGIIVEARRVDPWEH